MADGLLITVAPTGAETSKADARQVIDFVGQRLIEVAQGIVRECCQVDDGVDPVELIGLHLA